MFQSHSVLRRYTPPTCTLAIMAETSPLSRWAGQTVVKNLHFQLSLDDLKLAEDKKVTVKGDRFQLEALCEAVTTYVQNLLEQPASALIVNPPPLESNSSSLTLVDPLPPPLSLSPPTATNETGIDLHSKGLLSHELVLGSLATEESGPTLNLSTLQLFDLANALDEYATDILDLPTLQSSEKFGFPRNWAQIAAVALLAVGLSTSAIKLLDGSSKQSNQVPVSSEGASSADQRIATQLPPAVVDQAAPPVLSAERLPPPPPAGSLVPNQPGAPTVTTPKGAAPSPSPGQLPGGTIASNPVPVPSRPTIISQSVEPITGAAAGKPQSSQSTAIAPAPSMADSASRNTSESSVQQARRGALLKEPSDNTQPGTAFDTIPQVAEARDYFKQHWKPVEGLTQTLEYSLLINANGTIESITPLKQASGDYIDRTGMPLIGDPFVSPIKDGRNAKIRLVLEPDGQVQTFLEGF
ncbi:DUF4335 domain-containing protein [Leptodesmis sp.]|uniref:DUF4335 domain-containing protein n=1 Tax=Leptodesmis sp. TaxID=3100501 RepID=UPI0040534774